MQVGAGIGFVLGILGMLVLFFGEPRLVSSVATGYVLIGVPWVMITAAEAGRVVLTRIGELQEKSNTSTRQ